MIRNRVARRDGARIAYAVRRPIGRRRPWLVLIQGLGLDRHGWGPAADGLSEHFALLLVDNRGSGRSDDPRGRLEIGDMAQDVLAVLDHAGVTRAHVAGVSMGGMIAQEVAVRAADRVESLVLGCTTPGWPSGYPMPASTVTLLAASGTMAPEAALRRNLANALAPATVAAQPQLVDRLVAEQRDVPAGGAGLRAQVAAGARFGALRQASITARTLILQGGADRVVDPRNARRLADRIPGAQLIVFPELGHLFFREDPALFVRTVTRFALSGRVP